MHVMNCLECCISCNTPMTPYSKSVKTYVHLFMENYLWKERFINLYKPEYTVSLFPQNIWSPQSPDSEEKMEGLSMGYKL